MSTGPVTVASRESRSRSARWVSPARRATCRPASPHASAASTAAPRVLDTTATLGPAGAGCAASRTAVSSISPRFATAITPACSNRACRVSSGVAAVARAPARRRPVTDRPTITVRTGMLRPTRRAVRANLGGFAIDSRYSRASLVAGSDSHHSSMSVAGHVVFVAQRDEGGDPDADPRQVLGQGEAGATGRLQRQASASPPGVTGRERRVQAGTGAGHPEAGRPDHPHAVAAADAQQLRAGRAVESRREHHQRLDPALPAFFGDTDYGRRRRSNDRQVDCPGQSGRRRDAGNAVQLGHGRVDRVDGAGEAAGHDAVQDGPPDRAGPPAGADDRDRGRRQHMPQAGHVGRPLPLGHRLTVGAEGDVLLAGRQREGEVVHAVVQGAVRLQPGVGEHPQHGRVLAQRLRGEGAQAAAPGQRDQVLHQQHADAAVVHVIGDRKGDLGRPGRGSVALVAAAADQLAVQHGEQRGVVRRGLTADPARLPFGRARAHAEEAQVQTVRGQLLVHLPHRVEVVGPRGPDLDRGAVVQQSVNIRLGVCAHIAPRFCDG